MEEKEGAIKKLAETFIKSGLATNMAEAMEKAKGSFGAEEILKKVQSIEPFLKEDKTVNEILNEVKEESKEASESSEIEESKEEVKTETQTEESLGKKEEIRINEIKEIIDLDEESEAEKSSEEE